MSTESPAPPAAVPFVRVEYVGFQDLAEHREYRLRAYGREGSTEFRFAIATAAFGAGRVSLQDGPSVCYQRLLRLIAAGETASPDVVSIEAAELAIYREAHAPVRKQGFSTPVSPPAAPVVLGQPAKRPYAQRLVTAPVENDPAPGLQEGQRVSHALFGPGVTTAARVGHTGIRFDTAGAKMFVTSLLEVDVLSAPHTWETSTRGTNRPCRAVAAPAELAHKEVARLVVE
jgi:hypothetical protein